MTDLKLPALVGDGMVLQQNSVSRIWGWNTFPESSVSIVCDWFEETLSVESAADGYWECMVPVPTADHQLHSIEISARDETVRIAGVLFGEVWFAGGQSNMEMRMRGYWRAPVEGSNREIAEAGLYPEIRCFTASRNASLTPQEDFSGRWETASPSTLPQWSAVAWFFAKHLYLTLGVPVGVIVSSWGGSKIEAWLPEEDLKRFQDVDYSSIDAFDGSVSSVSMNAPYLMYYGMLKPLTRYTVKGIIFYQGCSNVGTHRTYAAKMETLAARWRSDFGLGDIPFYFVEITPYIYDPRENGMAVWGALLREAQCRAQSLIPNSQMVSTNDLVEQWEAASIHPGRKEPIGERLAWCALNRDYGYESICCSYPTFKSAAVREGAIEVSFTNSQDAPASWDEFTNASGGGGVRVRSYLLDQLRGVKGFEVAGEDRIFKPAAIIDLGPDPSSFVVASPEVPAPVAVRYCFHDYQVGNLFNQRGMPAIPFRSDEW